jgi:hypothetical protein
MARPTKRPSVPARRPRKPAARTSVPRRSAPLAPGARKAAARSPGAAATAADALIAALPEPRRSEIGKVDRFIRETVPSLERGAGGGMIGYGPFHYRYASGREGDTWKIALSSRAQYISLYTCAADARGHVAERYRDRLPAADIGKGCVRFRRFDDLDPAAVRDLLRETAATGYGL